MNSKEYPMRINKYLYREGICSRREADRLIEKGQVKINGKRAVLGAKVNETDEVTLSKDATKKTQNKKYYLLHKPKGVVSHNPQNGETSAEELFEGSARQLKLSPLGRLDKASRGLMLFSNDGTIVDKLLNPKYEHEKEYVIEVDKRISKEFMDAFEQGVNIEGYKTKPAKVFKKSPRTCTVILTEGKKHQLRRMCAALGYQVIDLKRVRIMDLRIGTLKPGQFKEVKGLELVNFMKSIGVIKK